MILRIFKIELWRHRLPIALHAVALAIALLLVSIVSTMTRLMVSHDVPGFQCPSGVREVVIVDRDFISSSPDAATTDAIANVRGRVRVATAYQVQTKRPGGGEDEIVESTWIQPDLAVAACLIGADAHHGPTGDPWAVVASDHPLAVDLGQQVQLGALAFGVDVAVDDFNGLGSGGNPAAWVVSEDIPAAVRDGRTTSTRTFLILEQGAAWESAIQELEQAVRQSALIAEDSRLVVVGADGRSDDDRARARTGLLVLSLLAAAACIATTVNLFNFYVSRQPAFSALAGTMFAIGVPARRLFILGAAEPTTVTVTAAVLVQVLRWFIEQGSASQVEANKLHLSDAVPVLATAVVMALCVAWMRVRAARASLRGGVGGGNRRAERWYPWLAVLQAIISVPVLALAVQTGLHWERTRPPEPAFAIDGLQVIELALAANESAGQKRARWVSLEQDQASGRRWPSALVTSLAPFVPQDGEQIDVVAGDSELPVKMVQVSDGFFDVLSWSRAARVGTDDRTVVVSSALWDALAQADDTDRLTFRRRGRDDALTLGVGGRVEDLNSHRDLRTSVGAYLVSSSDIDIGMRAIVVVKAPAGAATSAIMKEAESIAEAMNAKITRVRDARAVYGDATERTRYAAQMLLIIALGTTIAAAAGLTALLAAWMAHAQRELAVRYAMGAARPDVAADMLKKVVPGIAIGLCIGGGIALAATRAMAGVNAETRPFASIAVLAGLLLASALVVALLTSQIRRIQSAEFAEWLRSE